MKSYRTEINLAELSLCKQKAFAQRKLVAISNLKINKDLLFGLQYIVSSKSVSKMKTELYQCIMSSKWCLTSLRLKLTMDSSEYFLGNAVCTNPAFAVIFDFSR